MTGHFWLFAALALLAGTFGVASASDGRVGLAAFHVFCAICFGFFAGAEVDQ